MRIIQQTELDQVWAESLQAGQVRYHATEFELRADLPPQIAQGWDHQIDLRQGLSIQCLSGKFCQALALDRQHSDQFPLTLKFYLAGNSRVVAPGVQDVAADYEECCGHHYLYCLPDMREMEYYEAEKPLSIVYISLEPEYLKSFCSDGAPLPTTLQRIFHGLPEQRFYKAFGKMSPAIQRTVQQILNCPYGGLTKQVYLESKALELLSMQLVHCQDSLQPPTRTSVLRSTDVERLHQAKALLSQNLEHPPSLPELARQVGLNRRKLNEGFQYLFGTTPFGSLRSDRLTQAKALLMNSELSIESVAKQVGYADRSAFAAAFRKQFGVNPKAYQLQQNHF